MSNNPQYPGYGPSGPHQHNAGPPGPAWHGQPLPPMPPGGKARGRGVVITVVAVVLAAVIGGGVWLSQSGDDPGRPGAGTQGAQGGTDIAQADLTTNPDLEPLDFPDLEKFDYSKGTDALCAALGKIMAERGYEKGRAQGAGCGFETPAAAAVKDGSHLLRATIEGGSGTQVYNNAITETTSYRDETLNVPDHDYNWSELEKFPVGKAGFITYAVPLPASADVRAAFTSGAQSYRIYLSGTMVRRGDEHGHHPIAKEDGYHELIGIVQTLNGDPKANEPLGGAKFEDYAGLQDLGDPMPPLDGPEAQRCATLESAAAPLGVKLRRSSSGNRYYKCNMDPQDLTSDKNRYLDVTVWDYTNEEKLTASSRLDSDLFAKMGSVAEEDGTTPTVYRLPAGDTGYMFSRMNTGRNILTAAYVVGDIYVEINLSNSQAGRDVTEAELVAELADFLTKLG